MAKSFYEILGVAPNSSTDQIRARFLELARHLHPDRFTGARKAKAEEDFQQITQAFNVLTNPDRRREHDMTLARPQNPTSGSDPTQVARVYMQRGVKAYRERNYSAAADNFDRATKANPQDAKAWYHLALACCQEPRWLQQGVAASSRASELEPMNSSYLKLAGRLAAQAGLTEQAERYYNAALKWGDDDPSVRAALEELQKGQKGAGRRLFGWTK